MKHILEAHHKTHLSKLGVSDIPDHMEICPKEYREHLQAWERSGIKDKELLHTKVLGHVAWKRHAQAVADNERAKAQTVTHKHEHRHKFPLWVIGVLGLLLGLLIVPKAHCQFSKINTIETKNGGSGIGFHASPFKINCSTNTTCSDDGTTFTITASSSASTNWSALVAGTNSNAGTFAGSGNTWDFTAATLLKMRIAAGLTSSVNGDLGYDTTNKNWHIWANAVDNFIATIPVSVTVTNGHLATWSLSASVLTLNDGGPVPATLANVSHKWLNSYTSTTGLFTQTQPDYADLTGTPTLAANTTATAHNFFTAYNSTTGAFTKAQPACADVSDAAGGCSMSTTAGGDLSGTLPNPTVAKVNGIAHSATAAAHSVQVVTVANTTATAKTIPDCIDTGGNHLNFTQSTDAFSCGTSSSGGGSAAPIFQLTNDRNGTQVFLNNNDQRQYGFYLPYAVTFSRMMIWVTTADAGSTTYSIGLCNSSGTLVAHWATRTLPSTGQVDQTTVEGSVTIQPGKYYFVWTASGTASAIYATSVSSNLSFAQVGDLSTTTTGGTVTSITPPADNWTIFGQFPFLDLR